jgi:altronate dehydratase small subunit
MSRHVTAKVWVIAPQDNVGTVVGSGGEATQTLPIIGARDGTIQLTSPIPHGHKLALSPLPRGADVIKYGVVIGRLVQRVNVGDHVHIHNLESLRGRGDKQVPEGA